jgi:hypothetical protein
MAKRRSRTKIIEDDDDPIEFVADFDKNFPKRKPFSLFGKSTSDRRRRRNNETEPSLLCGVDQFAPEPPRVEKYSEKYSEPPTTPATTSCLPFRRGAGGRGPSLQDPSPSQLQPSTTRREDSSIPKDSYNIYIPVQDAKPPTTDASIRTATASSLPLSKVERLPDPPDIATAVQGLPLVDFETTANERALAKVSSWLLDNGLMDELLFSEQQQQQKSKTKRSISSSNKSVDSISVLSQEGFEVSTNMISGMAVEANAPQRLDTYVANYKFATQQKLNFYNSQLTEGEVVVTDADVQELVRAIQDPTTRKKKQGRLRELSTYVLVTNTDEMVQSKALAKCPKLKRVNHARRNLKKCFQELEYYSEIPLLCERLREELRQWSGTIDPTTLQCVSQDHVDLQVCLLETEAAFKHRMEEDTMQNYHRRRGGADDNWLQQRRRNNHNQVKKFMHHRTRIVWEVGDGIRTKIMAGIGRAFDEAMVGRPEGLTAMIEAVELYETVHERVPVLKSSGHYKNSGRSLGLVTMRPAALKQLFLHFELRGLQVFREVYQEVSSACLRSLLE